MPDSRLSWQEVCALRLERHALSAPAQGVSLADIAGTICGAHAQIMAAAELSLGLRAAGATRADVREALWTEHSLIKTYGPRGTVHLLPARELAMWTGALSAVPNAVPNAFLTPEQTDVVVAAIDDALADAELTVDELGEVVVASAGSWAGDPVMPAFNGMWPRWRSGISAAAHRGVLCFGTERGRKVTHTSPRRWLAGFKLDDGRAALAGLVKRYLYAYGPATPQQFAQWIAAPRRWAVDLFESLSGVLRQVDLDGATAWLSADDPAVVSAPAEGLRLLPYFDAYAVGCHPREKVFPGRAAERALTKGQAGTVPVMLIGGIVAGVWHQSRTGQKLDVRVEPFEPLTAAQRDELDGQIARVGEILEGKPVLTIGKVDAGKHL